MHPGAALCDRAGWCACGVRRLRDQLYRRPHRYGLPGMFLLWCVAVVVVVVVARGLFVRDASPLTVRGGVLVCVWAEGGEVYVWGDGSSGQIGQGGDKAARAKNARLPTRVDALLHTRIVKIACGWGHIAALNGTSLACVRSFVRSFVHLSWGNMAG